MPTTSVYLQPDAMLAITAPAGTFHVKVKIVSAAFHARQKLKYRYHCIKRVIVLKRQIRTLKC